MANALIGNLPTFNYELQDWKIYKERLDQWFCANVITEENDKAGSRRRAILLSALTENSYKLVRDLGHPKEIGTLSYKDIVEILDNHFQPRKCIIAERHRFHCATQLTGEGLKEWAARVRSLAAHCKFPSLDETMRDRFVLGMLSGPARDKLFMEDASNLTMAKAIDIAESVWSARTASQQTSSSTSQQLMIATGSDIGVNHVSKSKIKCSVCGYNNHSAKQCRFANYSCRRCNEKGHLSKMCPKKNNTVQHHYLEKNNDNGDDGKFFFICNIRTKNGEAMMQTVNVNGIDINFEIDSGSHVCTISDKMYREYFSKLPLKPNNLVLKVYTGAEIKPLGILQVPVKYESETKDIEFYVIVNGGPPLLGRNFLSVFNMQICKINYCDSVVSNDIIESLYIKYNSVFSDQLGCFNKYKVSLPLRSDAKPVFFKNRPVPFALKDKIETELNRLVQEGVLKPVQYSDYASPIVPVLKANGDLRICGDFSVSINKQLLIDRYPLPRIEELFAKLHGGEEFTKLDLSNAYLQLCLSEESQPLTCVNTHKGLFQYTRLIYGLSCAPAIFQKTIDSIISGIEGVLVFLDDILITGVDKDQHLLRLNQVLGRLHDAGLVLQKQKCYFFQKSVSYLGFVIDKNGLHKSPEKIQAIVDAVPPKNVSQLKSFLGIVNYYRLFIPNASMVLSPLYDLLQKGKKWEWTKNHDTVFSKIKTELSSDRVLAHFNCGAKLILTVDASPTGLGAILSQIEEGKEKPISYASRVLTKAEKNYSQIQKEATAIIFGIRRYHQYLYGRSEPFVLRTDHKPLLSIFKPGKGIPEVTANRLQRYAIFMSAYNYIIEYVRSENNCADYLSRACIDSELIPLVTLQSRQNRSDDSSSDDSLIDRAAYVNFITAGDLPITLEMVRGETEKDSVLPRVIYYVKNGWPRNCKDDVSPFFKCRSQISFENGCLLRGHKLIIPKSLQERILKELHNSHLGICKTKNEARARFWWPKIDNDIENYIGTCEICLQLRPAPPRAPLTPWPFPSHPWQRVHIDLLGPINNRTCLIIIDAFTKWVECFEVHNCSSSTIIDKLLEVISRFGIMQTIVSDNGTYFTSEEFKNFCLLNTITHITSPTYSPASNGQAEAYVKIVKKAIKSIIASSCNKKQFHDKLREYLFTYRNSVHFTTKQSPAKLMFGRQLRSRFDSLINNQLKSFSDNDLNSVVKRNQFLQCKHYHGSRNVKFNKNDSVLVRCTKANVKYWLPGVVLKKIGLAIYIIYIPSLNITVKKHTNQIIMQNATVTTSDVGSPSNNIEEVDLNEFWAYTNQTKPSSESRMSIPSAEVNMETIARPTTGETLFDFNSGVESVSTHADEEEEEDDSDCSFSSLVQEEYINEVPLNEGINAREGPNALPAITRSGTDRRLRDIPRVNYKE